MVGLVQVGGHTQHLTADLKPPTNSKHDMLRVFLKTKFYSKNIPHLGISMKVVKWRVPNELSPNQSAVIFIQNRVKQIVNAHFSHTSRSPLQIQSLRKDRDSDKASFIMIQLNLPVLLCPQRPSMVDHVIDRQP